MNYSITDNKKSNFDSVLRLGQITGVICEKSQKRNIGKIKKFIEHKVRQL